MPHRLLTSQGQARRQTRGQYRPVGPIGTSAASGTKLGKGTEIGPRNLEGPVSTLLDEQETPTSGRGQDGFSGMLTQALATDPIAQQPNQTKV